MHKPKILYWALVISLHAFLMPPMASAGKQQTLDTFDIPYERATLSNGLTLLVHTDRKIPMVSVDVWYHVGSKNEVPGKTGYAHLFEHLMFNGSEHFDGDYISEVRGYGSSRLNGTTNIDRTNYYQTIPTNALDRVLFLESDRMGHLLGAVTQTKLDEQLKVVKNEKRQRENRPYALVFPTIVKHTYPDGHPYQWLPIGKMEDLDRATLKDMHTWFQRYYGAANAVIVLAGDIDMATALPKVKKYFGHISSGPPISRPNVWIAKRHEIRRHTMEDQVSFPQLNMVWNVPEMASEAHDHLSLIANALASGKSSPLVKRLVMEEQLANSVSAFVWPKELGSQFVIRVNLKSIDAITRAEDIVWNALKTFKRKGLSKKKLKTLKFLHRLRFMQPMERLGGMGGKSDVLAYYETLAGDADHHKTVDRRIQKARSSDLKRTAKAWLDEGCFILSVLPHDQEADSSQAQGPRKLPDLGSFQTPTFPKVEQFELSNGIPVYFSQNRELPFVHIDILLPHGHAEETPAHAGIGKLSTTLWTQRSETLDSFELSQRHRELGSGIHASMDLENARFNLSTIAPSLKESLALAWDIFQNPKIDLKDFERIKSSTLDAITSRAKDPSKTASRLLPSLLYPEDHAYHGKPLSGMGTQASLEAVTLNTVLGHINRLKSQGSLSIVATGDLTKETLKDALDQSFGKFKPKVFRTLKQKTRSGPHVQKNVFYLINQPRAAQTIITVARLTLPFSDDARHALAMANRMFSGTFASRINQNLREDKGWSYGARSRLWDVKGPQPWVLTAPVQSDRTLDTIEELLKEAHHLSTSNPFLAFELKRPKMSVLRKMAGRWETQGRVANDIVFTLKHGFEMDYFSKAIKRIEAVTLRDTQVLAERYLAKGPYLWILVGDVKTFENALRKKKLGDVIKIDDVSAFLNGSHKE